MATNFIKTVKTNQEAKLIEGEGTSDTPIQSIDPIGGSGNAISGLRSDWLIALIASNRQYVVAEGGGGGAVNANRNTLGPWETFELIQLSGNYVALRASNGQYVVAEGGGGGVVNANRNTLGPWETFELVSLDVNHVAFKASNGKYVVAEGGGGKALRADRDAIGPWETFEIIYVKRTPQVQIVDSYMQQVGLPKSAELGEERWVNACEVRAEQGAGTFNSGKTETCTYQHDIPGWQILEYQIEVLENKYERGSYKGDIIAKDGNFTVNEQQIGDKWKAAIELAIKYNDVEAKGKLELEYQRHQQLIRSYASNKNTFFLSATANGGLARKSVIHVKAKVKMIRIM